MNRLSSAVADQPVIALNKKHGLVDVVPAEVSDERIGSCSGTGPVLLLKQFVVVQLGQC